MRPALREAAHELLAAALEAADPAAAVRRSLALDGEVLRVGQTRLPLARGARLRVVGGGKAGRAMTEAAVAVLGERIEGGVVIVPEVSPGAIGPVALREGGHPVPTAAGVAGATELERLLDGLRPEDLVLCLLSGGGSSLLALPAAGLTLEDLVETTHALLRAGCPIGEVNTVRKHLTRLGGGQLAARAHPARVAALVLSDVVGSPLEVIASGPATADPTTFAEALAVTERARERGLLVPGSVEAALREGASGTRPETPKAGDPRLAGVVQTLVGSNVVSAEAVVRRARELGFATLLLSTFLEGEAREVGRILAGVLRELVTSDRPLARPACVVLGGETTVTVQGRGRGGRNQELALSAALALDGLEGVLLVSLATDGVDGPTDAAGAMVDGGTIARGGALGLQARAHLAENDAYPYLAATGDLLRLGPTGTNVNDLVLLLAG